MSLTAQQIERYSRQIILQEVGNSGQEKLLASTVLIIGIGGLGAPIAQYLAAAGVGRIGLVDCDNVDLSNLQRQILHYTPDVGRPKVESAAEKIKLINPDVKVETHQTYVSAANIRPLIEKYAFIIDCTDNFPTKFLINDACVMVKKPFSHAGILRFEGQMFTYVPDGQTGCYRCLFKELQPGKVPGCSQAGILGAVAGVIGTLQAEEALKYFLNEGELLTNRLLIHQAKQAKFREFKFKRNTDCPICGDHPTITELKGV